eukprot:165954-Chlamydomonas_euryale.AAC.1
MGCVEGGADGVCRGRCGWGVWREVRMGCVEGGYSWARAAGRVTMCMRCGEARSSCGAATGCFGVRFLLLVLAWGCRAPLACAACAHAGCRSLQSAMQVHLCGRDSLDDLSARFAWHVAGALGFRHGV